MADRTLRWIRNLLLTLAAALLGAGGALWFLAGTETGLRMLAELAATRLGDRLAFGAVEGRLAGPLRIDGLQLRYAGGQTGIERLELDWSPRKLLSGELRIEHLDLFDAAIVRSADAPPGDAPPDRELSLRLPFAVSIGRGAVHGLRYEDAGKPFAAQRVLLSARAHAGVLHIDTLQLDTLQFDAGELHATLAGGIGLDAASASQLSLQWTLEARQPDAPAGDGALQLEGTLDAYRFTMDTAMRGGQLPDTRLQASGNGNLQGLDISELRAQLLAGSLAGSGRLRWQPQLQWNLSLAASGLDPQHYLAEWPGRLSAQLESQGSYSDERLQLEARIAQLRGRLRDYSVAADADAALSGEQAQLSVQWQLDSARPGDIVGNGALQLEGTPDAWRFDTRAQVRGGPLPAGAWQARGEGTRQGLAVDALHGEVLEGTVAGRGRLDWQPRLQWDLAVEGERLNPGQHWPQWPGQLSGRLASTGSIVDGKPRLNATLTQLGGRLRDYPVGGDADIAVADTRVSIRTLALQSGDNRLTASGEIGEQLKLDAALQARDLSAVAPGLRGSADIDARVLGSLQQPQVKARLKAAGLEGPGFSTQSLQGELDLHRVDDAIQSVSLLAQDVSYAGRHFGATRLSVAGPLRAHRIRLDTRGDAGSAELALAGGWDGRQWQGQMETAQWDLPQTGAWKLAAPVTLALAHDAVQLPESCWVESRTAARLCGTFSGAPAGSWQAGARLQALPLTLLDDLLGTRLQWSSRLDGELQVSGSGGRLRAARLSSVVGSGAFRYGDQARPVEEPVKGIDLTAVLDADGVDASLAIALSGSDHLDTRVRLPAYQPLVTPWKQQPLSLSMRGRLRELASLAYLFEDVATFRGSVDIDLGASGTLGEPVLAGGIRVEDGNVAINRLGIELRELQMTVHSEQDGVSLRGSCVSGKGQLSVDGRLGFEDIARWRADVSVQGSDFEAVHIPEAVVLISPDLRASIRPPAIDLQGELHIPYARLKPRQLPAGVTVSRDVVIVDPEQTETRAERWKVTSRLRLSLGDKVTLDGFGVKGKLGGQLDLRDEPGRVTRGRGKLAIEKGTYTAYGRELDIVKGQLLFSDGPVDNPGLDFDAERVVGEVHAGVRARGTLKEPELSLYSSPALPDADIVSYITLGRPAAQAGQSTGSPADALALASGSYLAGSLGETLGLEEFKVESSGTLGEASLVLGTYLSPQLYVRYSAALNDTANRFEAFYELNRNWSIRTETGQTASGADVIFSFER